MKSRQLKKVFIEELRKEDWDVCFEPYLKLSPSQLINPLISLLYHHQPIIKWRAITMIGKSIAQYALSDKESARGIIRRFMWYLNEESGGVGWGIPEAFGEVLSCYQWMAKEYASILVYYIVPGGTFLDMQQLQSGVIWGIGRGAQGNKDYFQFAGNHLLPFLNANNLLQRGLSLWAMKQLNFIPPKEKIQFLKNEHQMIEIYDDCMLKQITIADLAKSLMNEEGTL